MRTIVQQREDGAKVGRLEGGGEMRLTLFAVLLVVPAALADVEPKDKKVVAREIVVSGLPSIRAAFGEPTKITSKEDAEKTLGKELSEKVLKEVDLKKEFLLLFRWSGSGGDKLSMTQDKGTVTFHLQRGRTKDLRMHAKLYALPNKTEYKLP
jgi:hypothetical protein